MDQMARTEKQQYDPKNPNEQEEERRKQGLGQGQGRAACGSGGNVSILVVSNSSINIYINPSRGTKGLAGVVHREGGGATISKQRNPKTRKLNEILVVASCGRQL